MAELANVWVTILPDTSKIAPKVKKAFREIEKQAAEAGKKSGKDIADGITKGGAGDKLGKDIKDGLDKAGKAAESAGDKAGKGFSSHFTKWFKGPAAKAGGEAGVNAGKMFADGFKKHSAKIGLAAGAVTGAIGLIGKSSVEYAAEAEQSYGAVESIFGKHADVITSASKQAADAVGLSGREYREMASSMGAMLGNIGTPVDEVAGKTKDLVGLGADLAATFGGPTSDAVGAISALLRGETDPIERYGVSIKQADLQARMAADGMKDLTGDAKKQAQAQTLLKMLTEQSSGAVGQFGRETDTAAHKQQVANAKIGDAKEKIGTLLLPVMSKFADVLAKVADAAAKHPKLFTALGLAIGGAALAIGAAAAVAPILTAWSAAATAAGVSMGALAGSMAAVAAPFIAIGAAVVAAGVALWAFFTKTKIGRKIWKKFVDGLKRGWEVLKRVFAKGKQILHQFASAVAKALHKLRDHVAAFFARLHMGERFAAWKSKVAAVFRGIARSWERLKAVFGAVKDALAPVVSGVVQHFQALRDKVAESIDRVKAVIDGLDLVGKFDAAKQKVKAVVDFVKNAISRLHVGGKAKEFGTGLGQFADTYLKPIGKAVLWLGKVIFKVKQTELKAVGFVVRRIFALVKMLAKALGWLAKQIFTALKPVGRFIAMVVTKLIVPAFKLLGKSIKAVWTTVIKPVWAVIKSAFGLLADVLTGNFGNIKNRFSEMGRGMRRVWANLVGNLKRGWELIKRAFTIGKIILAKKIMEMIQHFRIFKARVSAAFQQVKNKFTAFVNGVKAIPGKIKAAFSGAGQWLLDAGKAIIRGLADGIRSAGHVIGDAVRAVVPDSMERFVPGLSIGGVIPAFARGGVLPDIPGVSRMQRDPILGWSADQKRPVARVEPGEFIVNREATARHLPLLAAINGGRLNPRKGDLGLPGYADGGVVGFGDVMKLVKGGFGAPAPLEGYPYTWAGGLMANWGDCSGTQSAIAALVAGVTLAGRKFATASEAAWLAAHNFVRGLGPKKNAYAVGFLNGGPGGGHTAGTIYDADGRAVNIEMGGNRGNGQVGGGAAGAADFPNVFWHPLKSAVKVLSTSVTGAKVSTDEGDSTATAKEVDWGTAASLFDETKKRFGVFDTGGLLASGSAAVNLSGRPERVLPPQLTTVFDRFVQLLMAGGSAGAPGGSGVLRYTQLVRDAEKGLAQTRQKSGVTAKEVAAAEETVRLAQLTAAKDTATTVAGVFRSPLDSLSKLAEMSGSQQAIIATQVLQAAKQIAEVISGLVVDVFKAMSAAAGVVADHFAALREQGKAVADLRATIVGLGIDFVKAQIDMAAAARQRRLTEVSGQVAVAEAIASVAQRQAAFDAQRKADAKAQLALYDDLSAGLDRFRWKMAGGFNQAMGDMAAWSDESHALYSELLAAQTGIQLAQQVAAKNNLEAVYKQVEASFKLSDAVQGLNFAAKQLQIMSKNHFGMDQAGATAGERYAQLTQELAEIEAKKADIKTWANPANWFNGYYENANRRESQIRAELDKLAASKEFQAAGIDRSMVDKIVASAGASGFFGAGDQIGDLIKNSALGDATRALQRAEYEKRQLEIEKQKADLGTQVSKGRAEVDYLAKLQPLQDLIESLQLEKASHESAAKGWREKNEDVRRAYMRVSATQAEGAQKIVQIPDGKTAFSFDEVQDIITELGGSLEQIQGRVQRLEVPPVSGGTLIKTRRG